MKYQHLQEVAQTLQVEFIGSWYAGQNARAKAYVKDYQSSPHCVVRQDIAKGIGVLPASLVTSHALPRLRFVYIDVPEVAQGPEVDDKAYCVALHEVGHLMTYGPAEDFLSAVGLLHDVEIEIHAWRWAMENARLWTAEMHDVLIFTLTTYAQHARETGREDMVVLAQQCAEMSYVKVGRA